MMKLTKTGIGLLTRLYRSVLKKCFLINAGLWVLGVSLFPTNANAYILLSETDDEPLIQNADGTITLNWGSIDAQTGHLLNGPYLDAPLYYITNEILKLSGLKVSETTMPGSWHYTLHRADYDTKVNSEAFTLASVINLDSALHDLRIDVGNTRPDFIQQTNYKNTVYSGGNYILPYVDFIYDNTGQKPTWAVYFDVVLSDGRTHTVQSWSGGTLPYISITSEAGWTPIDASDPNTQYYLSWQNPDYDFGKNNPVSKIDRDIVIATGKEMLQKGKYWGLASYGISGWERNDTALIDNIAALDDVMGYWDDGSYIKKFDITQTTSKGAAEKTSTGFIQYGTIGANLKALDTAIGAKQTGTYITGANVYANLKALDTQVAANTSTLSAHTAVIDALDNNYYMNYGDSMAKSFIKAANDNNKNVIVRSAKHDVTIFGRQSDNTATTTKQAA